MKTNIRGAALAAAFAGTLTTTAGAQDQPRVDRPEYTEPQVFSADETVRAVAEAGYLPGQFAFIVRGGGRDGQRIYLNSEVDYRDAGTLTVVVRGAALAALTEQLGGPPEQGLIGRTIVVDSVAQRVRINITGGGQPTGQFYFQTHVLAERPDQIHVVPGRPVPIVRPR